MRAAPVASQSASALDALRLIRSENVGPVTYHNLVSYYGTPAKALDALPELSRRGGRKRPIQLCDRALAERELETIYAFGAQLLVHGDADYPQLLALAHDAPPVLCLLGNRSLWRERPLIGMVGARNASANGCALAKKLATELSQKRHIVVSGLARGIDTAAHQGALAGGTVAVIAGGIDVVYPPENESLYRAIAEKGCILAEAPFGTAPIARHFPARNRIIAAMCAGLVVLEASKKSGSLITAEYALDYGREVFAVPGSPLDPRCGGSNDLIRNGAVLTESADDILRNLAPTPFGRLLEPERPIFEAPPTIAPSDFDLGAARQRIHEKLGPDPVLLDELLAQCNTTPNILYTILLELELAGRLTRHIGGKVSVRMELES